MSCHICSRTGIRTCDAEEAEMKCHICGFCEREAVKEAARDFLTECINPDILLCKNCWHSDYCKAVEHV
jgi:hypothetical protein